MAKKDERTEDLNPRSEDIEEKVRRMLDPSIPDEPVAEPRPNQQSKTPSQPKIQAVSAVAEPEKTDIALSAPQLPVSEKKQTVEPKPETNSKKVIIPISHHDESAQPETPTAPTAPTVQKITITDHHESPQEVAEKLDEAIAELEAPVEARKKAEETTDIEHLDDALSAEISDTTEPIEPAESEIVVEDPAVLIDAKTDKAVEEIIAAEGDELLEVEDAVRDTDEPVKQPKKPRRGFRKTLKALWAKPAFRWALVLTVTSGIIIVMAVPTSRYFLLNTAGVRASSSMVVVDQSTQQPLKNVNITIGAVKGTTDENGRVDLKKIQLGPTKLVIEKRAFAPVNKSVVVGLGSNPLGEFSLIPTGSQYSFLVTDFLSGKPIPKIEASSGEASALSNERGVIKLTLEATNDEEFTASIKASGYRTESISVNPDDKSEHHVKLVPERKHIFVSKRTGTFDVYSVYIDGKDEKLLLAGSGNEKDNMVLVPHPSDDVVAFVSTRAGQLNSEGFILSNLILIHPEDGDTTNIVASERIQIVDWSGDNLVYVQIIAGASANSPKRYRLMSYNYKSSQNKELASSNYFNDVVSAKGSIYYAPSSAYQTAKVGLFKIQPDGSAEQKVFDQEVWNIFRTGYDQFALSVQQQWYDYQLGSKTPTKRNSAPANQTSRVYIDSPNNAQSLWTDSRDGKGALLMYALDDKKDVSLHSQSGLGYPIRWLSDATLTYRVKTDQETADYAISTQGGEPVKIQDVTNTASIDSWY